MINFLFILIIINLLILNKNLILNIFNYQNKFIFFNYFYN